MLSKEKLAAMKYLKKEYDNLQNDPILSLGCTVGLVNNDIFHWKITLLGPVDTPYAGGLFILTADFPDNYPNSKPEVKFVNKIYHLNVSPSNGHICISILNSYKPKTPIVDVISGIFSLFYNLLKMMLRFYLHLLLPKYPPKNISYYAYNFLIH